MIPLTSERGWSRRLVTGSAWVALWLILLAPARCAPGAEHFVSATGSDAGPGTQAAPWRTIDKANESLQPGDTVTLLPGDHEGVLSPRCDGLPGRPVTYRSSRPLAARLVGGNPIIALDKRRHITIDGLRVEPRNGRLLHANECEHLVVQNCRFEGSRGSYTGARLVKCRRVLLRGNVFTRLLSVRKGAVLVGNMIQADRCDRLVIEGNTIGHAGHSPAHLRECTHLVIRRNLFCAGWGRGFETFNATPMLFEENIITEEVDSGGSADSRGKVLAMDGIFRRNLVLRNYDMALASNSYIYREGMPAWVLKNSRLYSNTLYHNHTYSWIITARSGDLTTVSGNVWQNNIFYHNDPLGDFRALRIGRMGEGNRFVHNAFYGDRPGRKVIEIWADGKGYQRFTLAGAEKHMPGLFASNLEVEPRFVDGARDDCRLSPGSPCIDKGAPLTRTTQPGQGRRLPVADARWFYDGFGIAGQQGDLIFVGSDRRRCRVVKTDREANVLLVDRDLRWQAGEPVSAPYLGRSPDLGAMESGAEQEPWFHRLTVPPGVRWQPPTDPKAPLVATDFEDATLEQWGYVWNLDRKRATDYARVKDTAASGTYSLRLHATGRKSILAGDVKPRLWEIDRFPVVRFAYRIPKGVPVGAWLDCFDTEEHGAGRVCVGGSPARASGGSKDLNKYQLIDDNRWHTVVMDARVVRDAFPGVKYLQAFQFYTHRNGAKGQEFWVDDFAISPRGENRPTPVRKAP